MPVSSADIAGANASMANRKIEALEQRVDLLEKRLQTAGDIVAQMARTMDAMSMIVERIRATE